MAKSKIAKYKRKKNPSGLTETAIQAGAGFGGYAAVRFVARMAYAMAMKKFPKVAPHVGAAVGVVGAGGLYFASQKWDRISDYHEPLAIGGSIAALQTLVQTYAPGIGWIVGDYSPEQYGGGKAEQQVNTAAAMSDVDFDAMLNQDDVEAIDVSAPALPPASSDDLSGVGEEFLSELEAESGWAH